MPLLFRNICFKSVCVVLATLAGAGCGPSVAHEEHLESAPLIRDGALTKGYPAVVRLLAHFDAGAGSSTCTSTFISRNAMLTAAHCILHDNFGEATSASIYDGSRKLIMKFDLNEKLIDDENDIALIKFSGANPPATLPLRGGALTERSLFTMVGFGCDVWEQKSIRFNGKTTVCEGTGRKRYGNGFIGAINPMTYSGERYAEFQQTDAGLGKFQRLVLGQRSRLAPGDSGGPMIVRGEVAGVAETSNLDGGMFSYVRADLESMKKFYASAKSRGYLLK